ncbi:hypothetical protein AB838_08110 [Rhodobacteraceae bacterium (ex Bugula neritina AB1)]|nr:hypothetical protein AB838_08110 [Rhodobacteraceae bacterium (ex Bugula neritina AB1)]
MVDTSPPTPTFMSSSSFSEAVWILTPKKFMRFSRFAESAISRERRFWLSAAMTSIPPRSAAWIRRWYPGRSAFLPLSA